jgi:hypothetical protein
MKSDYDNRCSLKESVSPSHSTPRMLQVCSPGPCIPGTYLCYHPRRGLVVGRGGQAGGGDGKMRMNVNMNAVAVIVMTGI